MCLFARVMNRIHNRRKQSDGVFDAYGWGTVLPESTQEFGKTSVKVIMPTPENTVRDVG